jgi:hypothetical protein
VFVAVFEFSANPCQAIPAPHGAVIRFTETIDTAGQQEPPGNIFWRVVRFAKNNDPRSIIPSLPAQAGAARNFSSVSVSVSSYR